MIEEKKELSDSEKREASLERLRQLREKLFSKDISTARLAGFNLSWMQEDGLAILKEALFGDYPKTTKKAAAYGLRSMHGRMKKLGAEVLEQGRSHSDRMTREACVKALAIIKGQIPKRTGPKPGKGKIKGIAQRRSAGPRSARRR
ncbi:MAG: hypothetical protein AMJ65_02135 [Phycisphaerae bacterium SG8_4]|nr:MAG: hypothetical protein AMJ65_02135 [Phycisphaerae bacterium SG8_4]